MLYTRTFAAKDVGAARALLLRAVWSTVARITLASHRLLAVPRQLVRSPLCLCQCLLIKTNSAARAIVRAGSALTRLAVIILKAVAFSSGLIAYSLVRTLYPWVCWCCLLWGGGGGGCGRLSIRCVLRSPLTSRSLPNIDLLKLHSPQQDSLLLGHD